MNKKDVLLINLDTPDNADYLNTLLIIIRYGSKR